MIFPFHRMLRELTGLLVITLQSSSSVREVCGEQPTAPSKHSLDGASEREEGSSEEKEQKNDKESEALSSLNCACLWDTLPSATAIWRAPCDRYIGVTALEEAGVMKTCWRAADRGKLWEGSQHLRHREAGGCPSDVDSESQQVSCSWGCLSH